MGWLDQSLDAAFSGFTVRARLEHLQEHLQKLDERLTRLESKVDVLSGRTLTVENFREADRAQLKAEIAEFKFEIERALGRLKQLPPSDLT